MKKLPFWIEKQANKIIKPLITVETKIFVDDKLKRKFFSKSFVGNFLQLMYTQYAYNSSNYFVSSADFNNSRIKTKNNNGVFSNTYGNIFIGKIDTPANNSSYGTIWGTGTTAPAPLDFGVETPIAQGTGGGQLVYGAQRSIQGCQVSGADTSFILERTGTNNSGVSINVTEVGLLFLLNSSYYLILRDTFGAVAVADTKAITTQIKFQITT